MRGAHRQWGSTDSQLGAAGVYFHCKYHSCMTTLLLELETAKGLEQRGKNGINLKGSVVLEFLLLL